MDELLQLTPGAGDLVFRSTEPYVEIRQTQQVRWMHFADHAVQSCMSLADPHQLLLPYTQAMLSGLVFVNKPQRLLNLGLGGGSFVRFFARVWPDLEIESVDCSANVIALSQQFFQLPADALAYCMQAENFVADTEGSFDVIFCDLFSDSAHPDCLFTGTFYEHCHRILNDQGVLVVNLLITEESTMIRLLKQVKKQFPALALLAVTDHVNTVLIAVKKKNLDEARLLQRAGQLETEFSVELQTYVKCFQVLA